MLKTFSLHTLLAVLVIVLILTPVLVPLSHDHFVAGGDGRHAIQNHTCGSFELHKDLQAADICLACLRAGLFVALFATECASSAGVPVATAMLSAEFQPMESNQPACPKRGPPTSHS